MITLTVSGLAEMERALTALGDKVAVNILRDAGRTALAVVQADMQQHAGFDAESKGPHMRDSIKITATNRMNDERYITMVTLKVGPSKAHQMKALAQEFGTVKQVARPFIRPALDYNKAKVLRILAVEIRAGIENNR